MFKNCYCSCSCEKTSKENNAICSVIIFLLFCSALFSCNNVPRQSILPSSTGKTGEIIVVMEKAEWNGMLGDKVRNCFASEHPALPQSEPLFTLIQVPPVAFNGIFQKHRNIILLNKTVGADTNVISVKHNVWAKDQVVMEIKAENVTGLINNLKKNCSKMREFYRDAERKRIISNYSDMVDAGIVEEIKSKHDFSLTVPKGYHIAKNEIDFVWLRRETEEFSQGIFIYQSRYHDPDLFSDTLFKYIRDSVCKANVPGQTKGSYMMTMHDFPLVLSSLQFKNYPAHEVRGLWQVFNDFMGGPFMGLIIFDKEKNRTLFIEGYVFAPKHDKREYLRQVEAIVYSIVPDIPK